jgi:hypothetical protein
MGATQQPGAAASSGSGSHTESTEALMQRVMAEAAAVAEVKHEPLDFDLARASVSEEMMEDSMSPVAVADPMMSSSSPHFFDTSTVSMDDIFQQ